jgi:hypothetical protein
MIDFRTDPVAKAGYRHCHFLRIRINDGIEALPDLFPPTRFVATSLNPP